MKIEPGEPVEVIIYIEPGEPGQVLIYDEMGVPQWVTLAFRIPEHRMVRNHSYKMVTSVFDSLAPDMVVIAQLVER